VKWEDDVKQVFKAVKIYYWKKKRSKLKVEMSGSDIIEQAKTQRVVVPRMHCIQCIPLWL
jgi:hypothetical protein